MMGTKIFLIIGHKISTLRKFRILHIKLINPCRNLPKEPVCSISMVQTASRMRWKKFAMLSINSPTYLTRRSTAADTREVPDGPITDPSAICNT
tara:strand:+ start:4728 stop:5009 length:282 start_codon:yes stop_codon:yes gene_type:complete